MLGRILNGLEKTYLIKSWLIGIFLYASLLIFKDEFPELSITIYIYFGLCTFLFPFSKMILDEIRDNIDEDYIIMIKLILHNHTTIIILKLLLIILFWSFTPFILILGIIYTAL